MGAHAVDLDEKPPTLREALAQLEEVRAALGQTPDSSSTAVVELCRNWCADFAHLRQQLWVLETAYSDLAWSGGISPSTGPEAEAQLEELRGIALVLSATLKSLLR